MSIQMVSFQFISSAVGNAFHSYYIKAQSATLSNIFFLAPWKLMGVFSLNLGPLQINFHSLLFSATIRSFDMVLVYKRRVSAVKQVNILIFKKTININRFKQINKIVNIKHFRSYRVSKIINCRWSNKLCRYLVSFSFYILIMKNCLRISEFYCLIRKFILTNVFWQFFNFQRFQF